MNFEPLIFVICACVICAVIFPRAWKICAVIAGGFLLAWLACAFCVAFLG